MYILCTYAYMLDAYYIQHSMYIHIMYQHIQTYTVKQTIGRNDTLKDKRIKVNTDNFYTLSKISHFRIFYSTRLSVFYVKLRKENWTRLNGIRTVWKRDKRKSENRSLILVECFQNWSILSRCSLKVLQ